MNELLCQKCSHHRATVHITVLTNGAVAEVHLCIQCQAAEGKPNDPRCPKCGLTFRQIELRGRLGCPEDYAFFSDRIVPILERHHGSSKHIGKIPSEKQFSS